MRKAIAHSLAALTIIATVVMGSSSSAAAEDEWIIFNNHSGNCLWPKAYNVTAGTQIEQETCVAGRVTQELWNFRPTSSGYFRLRNYGNVREDVCMNVKGASSDNSAKVILWGCGSANTKNDQWLPVLVAREDNLDWYQLKNRKSGKCLDVQGASDRDGADLIQYTCDRNKRNQWFSWVRH